MPPCCEPLSSVGILTLRSRRNIHCLLAYALKPYPYNVMAGMVAWLLYHTFYMYQSTK